MHYSGENEMSGHKLFTCIDHAGHFPVGVASIVWAHTEHEARGLLTAALKAEGLPEKQFTLRQIDTGRPRAIVLRNGDY
jgi:hypothetical protein